MEHWLAVSRFTAWDWEVLIAYLAFTTLLGYLLRARDATIRDFFLGGRKLPWAAVSGSIIATEVSAVTFIGVPAIVYAQGGNITYLQLAIGTILARVIIGFWFTPVFYAREIYSPYQYMGEQLGAGVGQVTTGLFFLGAVLGQGVRVYATALVLETITGWPLAWSIWTIGLISILWTWLGGITTVIWTDVVQFVVFMIGGLVALFWIFGHVPGGAPAVFGEAAAAGKFQFWNLTTDPTVAFTLWAGLFGSTFLTMASHGTDQMMAQRMFCCRDAREARKAVISSSVSQLVTILMVLVGAGLYVFYRHFPLTEERAAFVAQKIDRIFPVFILDALPPGVTGLVIAAIFAAAISSLDSTLAALAQTTVSTVYRPLARAQRDEVHYIRVSRLMILFWGIALSGMAVLCARIHRYPDLLNLALSMTGYTYGALLGSFLMALLPTRVDGRGLFYGVPLSVVLVFGLSWHGPAQQLVVLLLALAIAGAACWRMRGEPGPIAVVLVLALAAVLVSWAPVSLDAGGNPLYLHLAWPWNYPIGCAVTMACALAVGRRQERPVPEGF